MRMFLPLVLGAAVLAGCERQQNQGGGGEQGGASNGSLYEGHAQPDSSNPASQQPGSGRVDRGGGASAGGPIDNSVPSTNSPRSGPSGYR